MRYTITHYHIYGWAVKVKKWYGWVTVKTFPFSKIKEALELFNNLNG